LTHCVAIREQIARARSRTEPSGVLSSRVSIGGGPPGKRTSINRLVEPGFQELSQGRLLRSRLGASVYHRFDMHVIRADARSPDAPVIARAAELLRAGKLVAFPTETVYGLGANALDPAAIERIYVAKGRPSYNPLIVHVASADGAHAVAANWPERAALLASAFWPGPRTIAVPKRPQVPDGVTAGLGSVAVRVPSHPVALALIAAAGVPVAAPSANRSMMLSPTSAQHVVTSLDGAVDMILDGGATTVGIEST